MLLAEIKTQDFLRSHLGEKAPLLRPASGTGTAVAHSFEKEGLFYEDIFLWFGELRPEGKAKLTTRLQEELNGQKPKHLLKWLKNYSAKYRAKGVAQPPKAWASQSPTEQMAFLMSEQNPFGLMNPAGRQALFEDSILTFDEIIRTENAPENLTVGDDLGSYEIRVAKGMNDRTKYMDLRDTVESYMEGKVGHQHLIHDWSSDPAQRAKTAAPYIELLDSTTWFLFWRQAKRNPEEISSIMTHPYLGVYNTPALDRLHRAVINGDAKKFNNKFRMVGARSFKADAEIQGFNDRHVPDFELRSGNKGARREFVEDMIEARLVSGDFSGLKDFRHEGFRTDAELSELLKPFLTEKEIATVAQFEAQFKWLKYSPAKIAHNHFRNKVVAPLFAWEKRLNLAYKMDLYKDQQKQFAKRLLEIATQYNAKVKRLTKAESKADLLETTTAKLEENLYLFGKKTRLEMDFENYLTPVPTQSPKITVATGKDVNVNKVNLGIEYSFRFPKELKPRKAADADAILRDLALSLSEKMKGTTPTLKTGGHGHGVSVNYKFNDRDGRNWRVEWDGVQRSYRAGKVHNAFGGHCEIPTPIFAPQTVQDDIAPLYDAAREKSLIPGRLGGGGHINVDFGHLKRDFPPKVGARKMANLIAYFESIREMTSFIWQHPKRNRVAIPTETKAGFERKLDQFNGDWTDLGLLLYESEYFNTYQGRKPKYTQLNLTALMFDSIPSEYRSGQLDIKNKNVQWFPDFGNDDKEKIEFRLFDAPDTAAMSGLQIKYIRAVLNKGYNSAENIRVVRKFTRDARKNWLENPKAFMAEARAHFKDLGLDFNEYKPFVVMAYLINEREPMTAAGETKEKNFLPAKNQKPVRNPQPAKVLGQTSGRQSFFPAALTPPAA
ncbi:MAG: hypothetical protein K2X47_17650 [Bdellovibrionales bacterium]|nr:hypothetical protein [Bdellovibrionales bacterium]